MRFGTTALRHHVVEGVADDVVAETVVAGTALDLDEETLAHRGFQRGRHLSTVEVEGRRQDAVVEVTAGERSERENLVRVMAGPRGAGAHRGSNGLGDGRPSGVEHAVVHGKQAD